VAEGPSPVRVLLDTNVILDLLLPRQPWLGQAQPMWDARDAGMILVCLPTSALTNIYYIGRRQIGQLRIMDGIRFCIANFELSSLERQDAEFALTLPGTDFEDNLQIACAVHAGVQYIVTRDPSDFTGTPAPLRVVDPPTLMTLISPPVP
jgi:predicted nucleic acid-binding protein